MKRIYLNLKRFDVPRDWGGINDLSKGAQWSKDIVSALEKLDGCRYTVFFPEAHVMTAVASSKKVRIGCQGVYRKDVEKGGNFGAFTTLRTAKSMSALGVTDAIIGHCEERNDKNELLQLGGGQGDVNIILNSEIKAAINCGMEVLYCIGEKSEEQPLKYEVLRHQLEVGLKDVDLSKVTIAYEPVWAIGVGKVPPDREYIEDITKFVKTIVNCPVVYGGGLKKDNAEMLGSIEALDGGLIALTRFGKDFGFYLNDFEDIVATYKKGAKI